MKILNKLRFLIALTLFYIPARDHASKRDYQKASEKLESYFRWMRSKGAYPEANILMALVSFRLGKLSLALDYVTIAFDQLDGSGWNYKAADRQYLKFYCSNLARFISVQDRVNLDESLFENIEFRDLDLGAVHRQIRSNFPLLKQASIA